MAKLLANKQPERVLHFFEELSKIPRESGNEKAVSDYILNWAERQGWRTTQDENLNVVIYKEGTEGYENSPAVILQAHMDMVCEKNMTSNHDFTKDPLPLKIDGDILSTGGETTLGADNGIGVAYAMAILEDGNISHPPIEVLFTVEEESTFKGIETIDPTLFSARYMINLDHAVEDEMLIGSCGGTGINIKLPIKKEKTKEGTVSMELSIKGMMGGHSGEDIHLGRGNAGTLLWRTLSSLNKGFDLGLADIQVGTSRLAIPREGRCSLSVIEADIQRIKDLLIRLKEEYILEYQGTAANLEIDFRPSQTPQSEVLTAESLEKILTYFYMIPDGIQEMSSTIEGAVATSINHGILLLDGDELQITAELRFAYTSAGQYIREKETRIVEMLGGTLEFFAGYNPWSPVHDSPLQKLAKDVYKHKFGGEMRAIAVHAGIECGVLVAKIPGLDAIGIGPNCWHFHSVQESMSLKSAQKTWEMLKEILATIK